MNCKCIYCGGDSKRHELVRRRVLGKRRSVYYISLERRRCVECGRTFRVESAVVLPYKHYEREIIFGVLEGLITCYTLGYEDYPTELTMIRWRSQIMQCVL